MKAKKTRLLPNIFLLLPAIAFAISMNLWLPGPVAAEEKEPETVLEDMIVTTGKTEKELLKIPAAISVITAEELLEKGHKSLVEFLKSVPGLHVSVDSEGSHFFIRGQQVPGGEGIQIYIDGRKALYSGGSYSGIVQGHKLDDIPIEMIERIEVVKAPAASIYGGGAAHGILHVYTKKAKKGDKPFYGSISASYGAWDTYKTNLAVRGIKGKFDYSATANIENADGFRDTDKEIYLGEVKVGFNIDTENRIGITAGVDQNERRYPSDFQLESDLENNRDSGRVRFPPSRGRFGPTPGGYQDPIETDSALLYGGIDYQGKVKGIDITTAFDISRMEEDTFEPGEVYDDGTTGQDETDDRTNDIFQYDLLLKKAVFEKGAIRDTVRLGVDYEYFKYDNDNNLSKHSTVETLTKHYGIFLNNEFAYAGFSLLAGIRFDKLDWDLENGLNDNYDGSFEKTSWDVAPSYHITDDMMVFYSLSQSYWFPNAFHLSMPSWFGDKINGPTIGSQIPEENFTSELGVKHILSEYLNYNITVYHTATKNKYKSTYDAPVWQRGGFTGYKPVGDATFKGVEFELAGKLSDWLAYRGGVTWTDATWDSGTITGSSKMDISGKHLEDVPVWAYSAGLTFFPANNISLAVDMNYEREIYTQPEVTPRFGATQEENDTYLTFDTKLNYEPLDYLSFHFLCANIFDEEYARVGISGMSGRTYDPRPGRYLEIGLTYKF